MSAFFQETVLSVHHWNDTLFSFTTTRNPTLRFKTGQFVMIGLEVNGKPLMRAYSVVSAHYEDHLEFYSIKVPDGPLTSKLQHLQVGDTLLVSKKPTGSLIIDNLTPAKNLYLLSTGTGLAPFMSVVRDPEFYDKFEKIILTHGVRWKSELGYFEHITEDMPDHEHFGDIVKEQLAEFSRQMNKGSREGQANTSRILDTFKSFIRSSDAPQQKTRLYAGNGPQLFSQPNLTSSPKPSDGNVNEPLPPDTTRPRQG